MSIAYTNEAISASSNLAPRCKSFTSSSFRCRMRVLVIDRSAILSAEEKGSD